MLQSHIRAATVLMLWAGIAAPAIAQPHKPGGAAAAVPHAAPAAPAAPRAAPMPHVAPQISAPRAAPQIHAAPQARAAPQIHAAPQVRAAPQIRNAPQISRVPQAPRQAARPDRTPRVATPKTPTTTGQGPQTQQRQQRLVSPQSTPGNRAGRELARPGTTPPANLGTPQQQQQNRAVQQQQLQQQNRAAQQQQLQQNRAAQAPAAQNQPNQRMLSGVNPAGPMRALRNQGFADQRAANLGGRALAQATFQGRFARQQFAGGQNWNWRRHRFFPIVIGWGGPLFWPYAYNDFVDYTFYPFAYDTFWPYAYDDVYQGMFGRYAYDPGTAYATVGRAPSSGGAAPSSGGGTPTVGADLCSGQTAGLTDWPIDQITQTVQPNDAQRGLLDDLRQATARALDILKASCPNALPATPAGRIEAMRVRLDAMLQAVRTVRAALDKFYQSLDDEQKARFNALSPDENQEQAQSRSQLAQACSQRASGLGAVPIDRIDRAVAPSGAQREALRELQNAMTDAGNLLQSECPTYRALTPAGRLEAMEQRLDTMLRAVQTVQPALEKFYGSLSDEQKERLNRLRPA